MSNLFNEQKGQVKNYTQAKGTFQVGFYGYSSINSTQKFDNWHNFSNYLLIVDTYSNIPKLYGMDKITIEEVMDKLDMFQSIFGNIDEFVWWDLEIISAYAGTQFTSKEFKE